ncbi:glycosyltransferase [Rhizobium sp. NTR19]|uniref:Glycosyltransferase n=1 Tax=Neorhizobium turbinariae TaxID=2937795 RepID=A0ABT0IUG3_9HYPH|nr:glycosyltransferase [Neorhizobium turbinariae]MCK8781506.1 glycosyltransferase [Neorhizobium turbinariae]
MQNTHRPVIAFVWDNFGPMHVDRCEAVAATGAKMIGVELFGTSPTYGWDAPAALFRKMTLYPEKPASRSTWVTAWRIWRTCRRERATHVFLSHYEMPAIFLAVVLMRLSDMKVYTMACSKFDDSRRHIGRELGKRLFMLPYNGAIAAGKRSQDYLRWLGIKRVEPGYNTLSLARVREQGASDPAPSGTPSADRHFTVIARLIKKKNLFVTLEAYAAYRRMTAHPKKLCICGSGPLEADLREKVNSMGLQTEVVFDGFLQSPDIAKRLGSTLALLLLSTEEQFGNVVIEAQAIGVPVIVSDRCGARDELVRSGYNGFVVEPDNPEGAAFFMKLLAEDEALWSTFAERSLAGSARGDSAAFAAAVTSLVGAA